MPNYCWNTTEVLGPAEDVEFFHERVRDPEDDTKFSIAQRLMPLPPSATKMVGGISGFTDIGYNLAIWLWGTKWGDFEPEFEPPNIYRYETAWGPMDNGLALVGRMFPTLTFITYWHEEDFHFGAFWVQGELIEHLGGDRLDMPDSPDDDDAADAFYEAQRVRLEKSAAALGNKAKVMAVRGIRA